MNKSITATKFSVSVPTELASFLNQYQQEHGVSRSEVFTKGLEKLREEELARAYREHAEEWEKDPDKDFWDKAALDDGISDSADT